MLLVVGVGSFFYIFPWHSSTSIATQLFNHEDCPLVAVNINKEYKYITRLLA